METQTANEAQVAYWNGPAAETWVDLQDRLDQQIDTLGRRAIDLLAPRAGERILDIGCGCGQTSLQLAQAVGPTGAVVGLDISEPMLAVARRRAAEAGLGQAEFLAADAQVHAFAPAAFDAAYSRFGVMFFADPPAAMANIRRAMKPGGRLAFVCWRAMAENALMTAPLAAAAPHLPPMPPPEPGAPGPFAFADKDRVRSILEQAGFRDVEITPHDELIGGGDLEQTLALSLRIGPLGMLLREYPDRRPLVVEAVRAVLETYVTPEGVRMPSATWMVRAAA